MATAKTFLSGKEHIPTKLAAIPKREKLRSGFTHARMLREYEDILKTLKGSGASPELVQHLTLAMVLKRAQQLEEHQKIVERKQHREGETISREKPFTNR